MPTETGSSNEKAKFQPSTIKGSSSLVALLVFCFLAPAAAETCGQLAAVKGANVEVLRQQPGHEGEAVRYALRVEDGHVLPLECDDIVVAGQDSSAKIILVTGKLSLAPETRIELAAHLPASGDTPAKVNLINLTYGKMRALVLKHLGEVKGKPPGQQSSFRVRTFSATAGVRGTDFFTAYDPNSGLMQQATIEGAVEVQQAGTKQRAVVEAGYQVSVDATPAALQAAEDEHKSGQARLEAPRELPQKSGKVLQTVPIRDSIRNQIRVASAVAKDDRDFSQAKAVETLGEPKTWTYEHETVPEKLKNIKNEF